MKGYFSDIPPIRYEGADSRNPLAFKFYDADRVILGKTMGEHLPFAMAWWHNLSAAGGDMFGGDTADKSFGTSCDDMKRARAKADAGFEFMERLGLRYFCFHDLDLVPEGRTTAETNDRLDEMADYLKQKMSTSGISLLWGTSNLFRSRRYMNGAATSNDADVVCCAAAQVKKALSITTELNGRGYVFWGGREGYDTLLNTDMALELEHLARFLGMAADYGRRIGFCGDFYIEPKPKEPMKHQYDFDASTAIGFLRKYELDRDFKLNIEANHATMAGHTFQHELRVSAINGMLGSIDANEGDYLLGWDTDQFPFGVYAATMCMYEVLKAGGMKNGGFNFDAKNRRASNRVEDMFLSYIHGMDTFALGLLKAAELIEDGRLDGFIQERYQSFSYGIGKKFADGNTTLEELAAYAEGLSGYPDPGSGQQEYLESIVNSVLFH